MWRIVPDNFIIMYENLYLPPDRGTEKLKHVFLFPFFIGVNVHSCVQLASQDQHPKYFSRTYLYKRGNARKEA